ncbi:hypothetical protein Dimus_033924 [Dionaea muscipula]
MAVSTTFSFVNILTTAFPPSAAEFIEPLNGLIIKPLLEFLQETNYSFFTNLHINPRHDCGWTREYPVVVAETGWTSVGKEADVNQLYAEIFLRVLVRHLRSGWGTLLRKEGVEEAYAYELVDKQNNRMARGAPAQHQGVLYPNLTKKYDPDFGSSSMVWFSHEVLAENCDALSSMPQ